jgi:hypothetical protein
MFWLGVGRGLSAQPNPFLEAVMAAEFQVSPFGRNITTRMKTDLHRPITGVGARWRMSSRRRPASFRLRLAAESLGREPRGCESHAVVPKTGRSIRSRSFGAPRIFVAGGLGRASHPAAQFPRPLLGRPLSTPRTSVGGAILLQSREPPASFKRPHAFAADRRVTVYPLTCPGEELSFQRGVLNRSRKSRRRTFP